MTDSPVVLLSRALDQAGRALDAVDAGNADNPTPCSGWTVRQLADHVATGPSTWARMVQGQDVDWSAVPEVPEGEWGRTFRAGGAELVRAMEQLPEDQQGSTGFQVAEYAVHSWDLARGTGVDLDLDDALAEAGLAAMRQGLAPDRRGDAFGSEVQVGEDARAYDRLVAFAGRDPR